MTAIHEVEKTLDPKKKKTLDDIIKETGLAERTVRHVLSQLNAEKKVIRSKYCDDMRKIHYRLNVT